MRILFASDLHGDVNQYSELKKIIDNGKIDLLILGGDLLRYSNDLEEQIDFIDHYLVDYFCSLNIRILVMNGNIEWLGAVKKLKELEKYNHIDILNSTTHFQYNRLSILGCPFINISPFTRKDYERRDLKTEIYYTDNLQYISTDSGDLLEVKSSYFNELRSIEEEISMFKGDSIWVMHAPPYGTKLDVVRNGGHIGSKAIKKQIELMQPVLTLHGHVHESPYMTGKWYDRIGKTISVNPGSKSELHAVVIELGDEGDVKSLQHSIFGKELIK